MRTLTICCLVLTLQLAADPATTAKKHRPVPEGYVGKPGMYPDPDLTPGETNPKVTQDNIRKNICNVHWSTDSLRDKESTETEKERTYDAYGIRHPKNNKGADQVCELDHLISLENGGSDGIKNMWPQCGPNGALLTRRYWKMKDRVENYVHNGICRDIPNAKRSSGPIPPKTLSLKRAQEILRGDWYACYQKFLKHQACN